MAWKTEVKKFIASGVSTASSTDLTPDTKFRRLLNVRVRAGGEITSRPGLIEIASGLGSINKIKTFDAGRVILEGGGNLKLIDVGSGAVTDLGVGGFGGGFAPSIVMWRPEGSGSRWAYVFGNGNAAKVQADGTTYGVGINPPGTGSSSYTIFNSTSDTFPDYGKPVATVSASGTGPTGANIVYAYRFRSSTLGVVSNFSTISDDVIGVGTQIDLSGIVSSSDPQVDLVDIFRGGGSLADMTFLDTINNGVSTYADVSTDDDILVNELQPTFENDKPFVITQANGSVTGGVALPYVWGPFEGHLLACGATTQPGTLFWTNGNDPDTADRANQLEVTGTNEPLMQGFIYDNRAYVFSNNRMYNIFPNIAGISRFATEATSCSRGAISPDAVTVGDRIYFVAKDGIYATRGGSEEPLSMDIYNMFPHEGSTGEPPDTLADMSLPEFREAQLDAANTTLHYDNGFLRFVYKNKAGNVSILVYDFSVGGWFYDEYLGQAIRVTYGMEGEYSTNTGAQAVLLGTNGGKLLRYAANADDNGQSIPCQVWTPFFDAGDPLRLKRWGDFTVGYDDGATTINVIPEFENGTDLNQASSVLPSSTGRTTKSVDLDNGHGRTARNLGVRFNWTQNSGAPPTLYQWVPSWDLKPEDAVQRAIEWHRPAGEGADAYIWGIELHIDTENADVEFAVWSEQVDTGIRFTANSGATVSFAASENPLRFAWPESAFRSGLVKVKPVNTETDNWRLTSWTWLAEKEPPVAPNVDTNWQKICTESNICYVTGILIEADTFNVAKDLVFKTRFEGGETTHTAREGNAFTHNGRNVVHFTFDEPFRAELGRVYSTGSAGDIRMYRFDWISHPEPAYLANWDATFKDYGGQNIIKGVEFYVDTLAEAKTVEVQLDGVTTETLTIPATNGRKEVTLPLSRDGNGEFPRAVTGRLFPTDLGKVFLYRFRWIADKEDEKVSNYNATWTEDGYAGAKFLQGAKVLHDNQNDAKQVEVDTDGSGTLGPFTLAASPRRDTAIITFDPPVITHSMRLRGNDLDQGYLHNVEWIWEPAPDLSPLWETQETSHAREGLKGWNHIRRGFLAFSDATATLNIELIVDGTTIAIAAISPADTDYYKQEWFAPANKFKAVKYRVRSSAPFRLYRDDCEVHIRSHGAVTRQGVGGPYTVVKPFGDQHFKVGARI